MTEHALNAMEALFQALNHKISNFIIAGGLVVVGQTEKLTPPQYKPLADISVSELFTDPQSAGTYMAAIGSAWILMQMAVLTCKGILLAFKKITQR